MSQRSNSESVQSSKSQNENDNPVLENGSHEKPEIELNLENVTSDTVRQRLKHRSIPKSIFTDELQEIKNTTEVKIEIEPTEIDTAENLTNGNVAAVVDFSSQVESGSIASASSSNGLKHPYNVNFVTEFVVYARGWIYDLFVEHQSLIIDLFVLVLLISYLIFFGFSIADGWETCPSYCDGVKFLFIITVLSAISLVYFQIIKRFFGKFLYKNCIQPFTKWVEEVWGYRFVQWLVYIIILAAVVVFLVIDTEGDRYRLVSVSGIVALTLLGYIFSKYPDRIHWRHVFWGLGLQFILALLILRWQVGQEVFQCLGDKVQIFLDFTDQGSSFVFGYLVTGNMTGWKNITLTYQGITILNETDINLPLQDQLFGFKVLPVMFYFSFFISILYYYGVMQWVVQKLGWCLEVTVGTTACESINAAACIFVGQTEAPLVIQRYLPSMTKSEIHAVMTGGFANIAGSTLAAYISFGIDASHLLTASIMSAPAALGFAKLMLPEVEISQTSSASITFEKGKEKNALEAAANGASIAIGLVANIAANLISFIAFIYFLDAIVEWMGLLVGLDISFEYLLSLVFTPLAFVMGVPWQDCQSVGKLIGIKTIINEFVAYSELATMMDNNELLPRSQTIATYALCGFSNLSSIGIQLGCMGGMAPGRKADFAQVVLRALISGSAACFMTACVAGALISDE